tara:strand:+ start:23993 stop:25027 length:1035 start_codon:yes stop_codon:yes gene_type:complete
MFAQGKKFERYQKKYKELVRKHHLNRISLTQLNIVDKLKSTRFADLGEGFTNAEQNPLEAKNLAEKQKLEVLEQEFNNNMSQYITKYKLYLQELATRQSSLNSSLKNKVVSYNGNYFYINNTGIARQFTDTSWKSKDESCPNSSSTLSPQEFSRLSLGPPMNIGELCRSGGYNAKDQSSGTTAWVDNLGFKHRYSDFINRHKTCPADTVTVTGVQYNAIPTGNVYGTNDTCNTMSLDSPLYDQLVALNQKMISGVTSMKGEVNKLAGEDVSIDKDIQAQKVQLENTYNELLKEKKKVDRFKMDIEQYRAEVEDQNLSVPSIQMHHLIWVIMGGAFIATAIYNSR